MLHGNVKTFDVICKTMVEERRAVKLALEGHISFIFCLFLVCAVQEICFNHK